MINSLKVARFYPVAKFWFSAWLNSKSHPLTPFLPLPPLPLQKVMHTRKRHMELFQELNQKFQTLDRYRDIPNMGGMVSNRKQGSVCLIAEYRGVPRCLCLAVSSGGAPVLSTGSEWLEELIVIHPVYSSGKIAHPPAPGGMRKEEEKRKSDWAIIVIHAHALIQNQGHELLTWLSFPFLLANRCLGNARDKNTIASDIGELLCAFCSTMHQLSVIVRPVGLFDWSRPIATQSHFIIQHHAAAEHSVSFGVQLTGTVRFTLIVN